MKQQFIVKRKIVFEKNDLAIEDHEDNMWTLSDIYIENVNTQTTFVSTSEEGIKIRDYKNMCTYFADLNQLTPVSYYDAINHESLA